MPSSIFINEIVGRRANEADLPSLGCLGVLLVRTQHGFDPQRFMAPHSGTAEGYAWFLGSQLAEEDVVVLVAERQGTIAGTLALAKTDQTFETSGQKSSKDGCSPSVFSMAKTFFAASGVIAIVAQVVNLSSMRAFVIGT
jgi:hypothetical protein